MSNELLCRLRAAQLGVSGILVLDARRDGPAYKAGIKGTTRDEYGRLVIGDVITAFKGIQIKCDQRIAERPFRPSLDRLPAQFC